MRTDSDAATVATALRGSQTVVKDTVLVRRSLGFLLQDASRLMRRRFIERAREAGLGLNRSEASVLIHVFHSPGLSQSAIATYMDIDTISLVRLVDGLAARGLVERRARLGDRRVRELWLTDAGRARHDDIRRVTARVRAQALSGLGDAEYEALLDLLSAVRGNLAASDEDAAVDLPPAS
jgi:MarR family transcriptional regulator for hemolysin